MDVHEATFLILSVLIDGPKGPGDKIDTYMQPLIEELKELWNEGVSTFDATQVCSPMMRVHIHMDLIHVSHPI